MRFPVRRWLELGDGGGGNARRIADRVTGRHPSCPRPLRVGSSISDAPSAAGCLDRFTSPDSKITTGHRSSQSKPPARQPWHSGLLLTGNALLVLAVMRRVRLRAKLAEKRTGLWRTSMSTVIG